MTNTGFWKPPWSVCGTDVPEPQPKHELGAPEVCHRYSMVYSQRHQCASFASFRRQSSAITRFNIPSPTNGASPRDTRIGVRRSGCASPSHIDEVAVQLSPSKFPEFDDIVE